MYADRNCRDRIADRYRSRLHIHFQKGTPPFFARRPVARTTLYRQVNRNFSKERSPETGMQVQWVWSARLRLMRGEQKATTAEKFNDS